MSHIPRSVCNYLSDLYHKRIRPEDIEPFEEASFVEAKVPRKLRNLRGEKPSKVQAFVAYLAGGDQLVWACDTHHPFPGRFYTVYTLRALLNRRGRRNNEIPVVPDTTILDEERRMSDTAMLVIGTTLHKVEVEKGEDSYTLLLGFAPEGRIARPKHDVELPESKPLQFVAAPSGLEYYELKAVWNEAIERDGAVPDFMVRVKIQGQGRLYDWTDRLNLDDDRALARVTANHIDRMFMQRTARLREAYDLAVHDMRLVGGGADAEAEAEMKARDFPNLAIAEACRDEAKAWVAGRDAKAEAARKAVEAPVVAGGGNGVAAAGDKDEKPARAKAKKGEPRRGGKAKGADKDAE